MYKNCFYLFTYTTVVSISIYDFKDFLKNTTITFICKTFLIKKNKECTITVDSSKLWHIWMKQIIEK